MVCCHLERRRAGWPVPSNGMHRIVAVDDPRLLVDIDQASRTLDTWMSGLPERSTSFVRMRERLSYFNIRLVFHSS
ncbi:hypothetical protein PISMIDRAFT_575692 [Pisolithus microcarpus 441]|uniref:Uncharacterized protein n=1 Tax=Pisolithus microcarpus 441 TaxID=765257 RepID=A0A0C9YV90_9AGAM|nr:hypothetical protein PISMIDRAFT_575692 [Pisolithus microcarpus 441]